MKVLVCDDEHLARERLTRMVNQLDGYQVIAQAKHGQDALDQLKTCSADIVILDIEMPVMDGFEATNAIRQKEAGSAQRTPIIALTANALRPARERCLKAGMDGHLAKPMTLKGLALALQAHLTSDVTSG